MGWLNQKLRNRFQFESNRLNTYLLGLSGAKIGRGSIIYRSVDIMNPGKMTIGNHCTVYKQVSIFVGEKGQFIMGDSSHIAPYCYFLIQDNEFQIGEKVAVGPFCSFFCHSNNYSSRDSTFINNYLDKPIWIGNNVFIGAHCVVLPGTVIENNVVVAANSVATGKLESGYIYGGTPLQQIKKLNDKDDNE